MDPARGTLVGDEGCASLLQSHNNLTLREKVNHERELMATSDLMNLSSLRKDDDSFFHDSRRFLLARRAWRLKRTADPRCNEVNRYSCGQYKALVRSRVILFSFASTFFGYKDFRNCLDAAFIDTRGLMETFPKPLILDIILFFYKNMSQSWERDIVYKKLLDSLVLISLDWCVSLWDLCGNTPSNHSQLFTLVDISQRWESSILDHAT